MSVDDTAMPERMHITGARTNINRTMTPFIHQITQCSLIDISSWEYVGTATAMYGRSLNRSNLKKINYSAGLIDSSLGLVVQQFNLRGTDKGPIKLLFIHKYGDSVQ